jgi:hypothetical protein
VIVQGTSDAEATNYAEKFFVDVGRATRGGLARHNRDASMHTESP